MMGRAPSARHALIEDDRQGSAAGGGPHSASRPFPDTT